MKVGKVLVIAVAMLTQAAVQADGAAEKKVWSGDTELGYVKQSGNTETETLTAKQSLVYDAKPWVNTLTLSGSNTSTDKQRTGEKYYITEQLDRFITERSYAFFRGTWEKDRYSGFENQSTALIGYGRKMLDTDGLNLKLELGYGRSMDEIEETSESIEENMAYLSEELNWKMNATSKLGQKLSVEDTEDNRITRFGIFLKSTLMGTFATKISYDIKNQDEVPDDLKHTDKELTVSLVYGF